jgi:uncharacterized membrane protein
MSYDTTNARRAGAMATQRQRTITTLRRTVLVMLPAWLVYFFAVDLFAHSLDTVTVPYVNMPLGTNLVILGCALTFPILLYLTRDLIAPSS